MFKTRPFALVLFISAIAVASAYSQEPVPIICEDMGLFQQFVDDVLTLDGNCDDADGRVSVAATSGGLVLRGLGSNKDIPLSLKDNITATAKKIKQFGIKNHRGTVTIITPASVKIDVVHNDGGSCSTDGLAVNAKRCKYEVQAVVASSCSLIGVLDILCGACKSPCSKYGNNGKKFVQVFAAGRPGETCSVKLKRVKKACRNCNGRSFAIVED